MRRIRFLVVATIVVSAVASALSVGSAHSPAHALTTAIDLPTPPGSGQFGKSVAVLANGNFVVTDPDYNTYGAVHLYNGVTNALISTLRGSTLGDSVGANGVLEVGNSNFIVTSPDWDNGSTADVGAVTWVNGTTGLSGEVSALNSLVGTAANDSVGGGQWRRLNNGNYIGTSPEWGDPGDLGAATWGNGNTGIVGPVSGSNSLIGAAAGDFDSADIRPLLNGNAVVVTAKWNNGGNNDAGAATWVNGAIGRSGTISNAISLVGTKADDVVGRFFTSFPNGNYVVSSNSWDNGATQDVGIATWGNGASGISGVASPANSLIGQVADDGDGGAYAYGLQNGNYLVVFPGWHNGSAANAGAVVWGNGATGTTGVVTAGNSIHGTLANDNVQRVRSLVNGHYVVYSRDLNVGGMAGAGGAMWADGTGPTSAAMSAANSIVGSTAGDHAGFTTALANGNYVVQSDWQNGGIAIGSATFANGSGPTALSINASNSLVGSSLDDMAMSSVDALLNGNYIVRSYQWNNGATLDVGAVTWGSGTTGVVGPISAANSLIGNVQDDHLGSGGEPLLNGDELIRSPDWNNGGIIDAGMARVISGTGPTTSLTDPTNSLVGSKPMDHVGSNVRDVPIGAGLAVISTDWDNGAISDAGALTVINGAGGPVGPVSAANSIVGSHPNDYAASFGGDADIVGGFVAVSPYIDFGANADAGAVTWIDPANSTGPLTADNSVFAQTAAGGMGLNYAWQRLTATDALVVGRPADNKVTLLITPDKTPPSLTTPANITVQAPRGEASAVVEYALPTGTDVRSAPVAVACNPPSGSTFSIGITTVTCVGTDGVGLTTTVTFTVTVISDYVPLAPARLADTRTGFATVDGANAGGGLLDVGSTLELQVTGRGGVAADASAAGLNVTAVDALAPGFATVWPCGEPRPTASNLNFATGATVPNAVIAKIGAGGKVCLFTSQPIHFVVDVNGYVPAATSYRALNPARLLDTRAGGITVDDAQRATGLVAADSTTTLQVTGRGGVPSDATSVVLNVTTTESALDGYITVSPCGTPRPNASSVNGVAATTVANLVISKLGDGGTVCLYSQSPTHLIADVNGYFAPGGSYVPLVPARLQDSRPGFATVDGQSAGAGLIPLGTVTTLHVTGRGGVPDASTVVLNITVTEPAAPGYLTVYQCGIDPPNASNLNYATDQTVANGALVKVGTGGNICLYNSQPTHLVVDVTGYFPG